MMSEWYQHDPRIDLRLRTPFTRPLGPPVAGYSHLPPSWRPLAPSRCARSLRASRPSSSWTAGPLLSPAHVFTASSASVQSSLRVGPNYSVTIRDELRLVTDEEARS